MLKENRTYRTIKGDRRFFIHGTRNKPVSNGCNFIGEDLKTGVLVCFDHQGKHSWEPELNLECDPYLWIGMAYPDKVHNQQFVKKEELKGEYTWYLRMEDRRPESIVCVDRAGFLNTYV